MCMPAYVIHLNKWWIYIDNDDTCWWSPKCMLIQISPNSSHCCNGGMCWLRRLSRNACLLIATLRNHFFRVTITPIYTRTSLTFSFSCDHQLYSTTVPSIIWYGSGFISLSQYCSCLFAFVQHSIHSIPSLTSSSVIHHIITTISLPLTPSYTYHCTHSWSMFDLFVMAMSTVFFDFSFFLMHMVHILAILLC